MSTRPPDTGGSGDVSDVGAGSRSGAVASIWTDRLGRWSTRSLQVLLLAALAAVVLWLFVQLKLAVIPVLIAIILASAASPLVRWLRRSGLSAGFAATITLLGSIVVLGGIFALIYFAVRSQWDTLASSAADGLDDFHVWLAELQLPIGDEQVSAARAAITEFLTSAQLGAGVLSGVSTLAEVVTGALLMIVVLFYFLKDGDRIWAFLLRPFHGPALERGHRIGPTSVEVLGSYVRGTAIVGLADATLIGLGLAILQVPLALPLAIIVFLGAFIPLVGATLAGAVAALVALAANGPVVALIVIALVVVVQELEGDLLQPLVMGNSLKLHPLVILLALTAGTIVAGIIGAVLAIPIAAVVWAIIRVWNRPDPSFQERVPFNRRRKKRKTGAVSSVDAPGDGLPVAEG